MPNTHSWVVEAKPHPLGLKIQKQKGVHFSYSTPTVPGVDGASCRVWAPLGPCSYIWSSLILPTCLPPKLPSSSPGQQTPGSGNEPPTSLCSRQLQADITEVLQKEGEGVAVGFLIIHRSHQEGNRRHGNSQEHNLGESGTLESASSTAAPMSLAEEGKGCASGCTVVKQQN